MVTIKGPIKLRMNGDSISKLIDDKIKDVGISKRKIPFDATGWKSEKNYKLVEGGKKLEKEDKDPKEPEIISATKVRRKRKVE